MIVFAFFDLNISIALYNKASLFAKIFEAIAEIPFTFIALTGFTVLFLTRNKTVKWKNISIAVISIIGILAYSIFYHFLCSKLLKSKECNDLWF